MKPITEIFSQGEELVNGHIVDSNAAWLSQQLAEMGFQVRRHTAVGDNMPDLIELFQEIANRADCCICTGGLGPTSDDLTAEAVSRASNLALELDVEALRHIQHYFSKRDRVMPEANKKQAFLPSKAERIDNAIGTAPGFALQFKRCWFAFLPGVPLEMQNMFNHQLREKLQHKFKLEPDDLITLRSMGIGESSIQQCLAPLVLPESVKLGFRVAAEQIQTKLLFPYAFPDLAKQKLVSEVAKLIGDYVFAIDSQAEQQGDLLSVISQLMNEKQLSLSLLETYSHGLLAAKCIAVPWLKHAEIGLNIGQIEAKWQIKTENNNWKSCAEQIAKQIQTRYQTDLTLVQLYCASNTDPLSPIVLYNALATRQSVFSSQQKLAGLLKQNQNQAALLALDLLRRYLQNKCL